MEEFVYSHLTQRLAKEALQHAQSILREEVGVKVGRAHFEWKGYRYPLRILLFTGGNRLGYFSPEWYEIGLRRDLYADRNLIRHELAHYLTHLEYGSGIAPHGAEFRAMCRRYGWDKAVYAATSATPQTRPSSLERRAKKLLALSKSGNQFEAEAALDKAKRLIGDLPLDDGGDEMRVRRILYGKRRSAKLDAIADILRTFSVYPVISRGNKSIALEIFGRPECVELADYVATYLDTELEHLWKNEASLKGSRQKAAFFRGITAGYVTRAHKAPQQPGLIRATRQVEASLHLAYPHLRREMRHVRTDPKAEQLGQARGSSLSIRKGVKATKDRIKSLIWAK